LPEARQGALGQYHPVFRTGTLSDIHEFHPAPAERGIEAISRIVFEQSFGHLAPSRISGAED
jgi:hypothetical protein